MSVRTRTIQRVIMDPREIAPYGAGVDGRVLTLDSARPDGLKWAVPPGGGGGAPTGASYVVLAVNGTLTAERVLTAGTGIVLTDAGAGSTLTVAANTLDTIPDPVAAVDFAQQEALRLRLENRTSDPASPAEGEIWLRIDL